jgi:hypothetical protein
MRRMVPFVGLLLACEATSSPPTATIPMASAQSLPSSPPARIDEVEGHYELDKEAFRQMTRATVTKTSPDNVEEAMKIADSIVDAMHVELEIRHDGTWSFISTAGDEPNQEPTKKSGKWTREGSGVVLSAEGKGMTCTMQHDRLACAEKANEEAGVFFRKLAR